MALPVILIDSATGSDTAASGAGPSTALTGSSASTDGAGTLVTLDGSPDLTNVATDGSHVIYLADTTAGARNFGKITAKDNGAKTVTVANAFGLSLSGKTWAIGGKRASLAGTTSAKLYDNNSTAGDAQAGWALELQSGHSETIAAAQTLRRAGDTTNGPFVIRGASGAVTRPLLTFSNNGNGLHLSAAHILLRDFELRNSNATKTSSVAVNSSSSQIASTLINLKISHSTDKFWKGVILYGIMNIQECEIGYCGNVGISQSDNARFNVVNCWIHDCGAGGIATANASAFGAHVTDCLITNNTGVGLLEQDTGSGTGASGPLICDRNTFDGNTSDGLKITGASSGRAFTLGSVCNNIFSNNGGYGINLSGSPTDAGLYANLFRMNGNAFYNNTSGTTTPASLPLTNLGSTSGTNPNFTNGNTANSNYTIGTALKATGYPAANIGTTSNTRSYLDPGAAQRQEAGGGMLLQRGFNGGIP